MRWSIVLVATLACIPCADASTTSMAKGTLAEVRADIAGCLKDAKYDELEAIATHFRKTRLQFPDGEWTIVEYFAAMGPKLTTDEEWRTRLDQLNAWLKARPKSGTAHGALMSGLIGYAWFARGTGWGNEVTADGSAQMTERSIRAEELGAKALALEPTCPGIHWLQIRIGHLREWERAKFDAAFAAATKVEPRCSTYHELKAYYLLPRWFGKEGEWEEFARQSADVAGGDAGAERYYRIVDRIVRMIGPAQIRQEAKFDEARAIAGLEVTLKAWPDSVQLKQRACQVACTVSNRPIAARLFSTMGERDSEIWPDAAQFDAAKRWALGE